MGFLLLFDRLYGNSGLHHDLGLFTYVTQRRLSPGGGEPLRQEALGEICIFKVSPCGNCCCAGVCSASQYNSSQSFLMT